MALDETLKSHFLNLYHIALSDSEITTEELQILYMIGEEKGITKTEIDEIVLSPDKVKFKPPSTVIEKMESLYDLTRISWADGVIDNNERRVLQMFCSKFGFRDENISEIVEFLIDQVQKGVSKDSVLNVVLENS